MTMLRALRSRTREEEGFTLVETMVVLVVFAILLAITVPIVSTVLQTSSRVNNTYTNEDKQLYLSTNFQRLVQAAVAPRASFTGTTPNTPFVTYTTGATTPSLTPTAVTFYANTGQATGPERVTARCTATPTHTTYCLSPSSTFRVTITPATKTSCPRSNKTKTKVCTYSSSATRRLLTITHVVNGYHSTPLFSYSYGSQPTPGKAMSVTTVCDATGIPAGCSGIVSTTFKSPTKCAASKTFTYKPFNTCPAGEIDRVAFDLQVNARTTSEYGGYQVEESTATFVLSSTSTLFDPAVG